MSLIEGPETVGEIRRGFPTLQDAPSAEYTPLHQPEKPSLRRRLVEYGYQPLIYGLGAGLIALAAMLSLDSLLQQRIVQQQKDEVTSTLKLNRSQVELALGAQKSVAETISDFLSSELVANRTVDEKQLADLANRQLARGESADLIIVRSDAGRLLWFAGEALQSSHPDVKKLVEELTTKSLRDQTPAAKLVGPYSDGTGRSILVAMEPVSRLETGNLPTLWGNVLVCLELDRLVEKSTFLNDPEMAASLSINSPGFDPQASIFGKPSHPFTEPVFLRSNLWGTSWSFRAEPIEGWRRGFHELIGYRLVGLLSALLLGMVVYMIKRHPRRLLVEIDRATTALRNSERKFRLSEERLNGILGSLDQVVWSGDPRTGQMLYLSPEAENLYGIKVEEFVRDPSLWLKVVHPEDRDKVGTYTQLLQHQGRVAMEYRIVRPDDSIRWVRDRGNVVRDEHGADVRLDGVISDITDQVRARQELAISQRRIKNIVQGAPIILYAIDYDGIFTVSEGRGLEALGQVSDEVVGLSIEEVYPNEPETRNDWRRALAGESFLTVREIRGYVFETWYSPILGEYDEIVGAVAVATDITARQFAEDALRESEDRFRRLATASTEGVFISIGGVIHDANETLARMLGISLVQLIGSSPTDHIVDADRPLALKLLSGEDETPHEMRFIRKDKTTFPVEMVGRAILYDGQMARVTSIRDITVQVQAKEQLLHAKEAAEAAVRAKGEFLANMSHEIRTPLNGVLGIAELLEGTRLDTQQKEYVRVIRNSGQGLLEIINNILDFSKIEAGKLELESTHFNLAECVESVVDLLAQKGVAKGLEVVLDLDPGMPTSVVGDPVRLRQVITNLLNNAIKFTEKGEVLLRIDLKEEKDGVGVFLFNVVDTGIGIPPERLDRLFRPFSQIDSSTTRKFGGTGLGLAISQQLVQAMGGVIRANSSHGRGSSFSFTLRYPIDVDKTPPPRARVLSRSLVLVAETNATARRVLQRHLAYWGARVGLLAEERPLREQLAAHPGALIAIVDQRFLRSFRMELTDLLRERGDELFLVVAISRPNARELNDVRSERNVAMIRKPIRFEALEDILRRHVSGEYDFDDPALYETQEREASLPRDQSAHAILVVEDNPVNQLVVVEMLRRMGFTCDSADNGLEAIKAIESVRYDLVLMDCQMPEMDGYEATRHIRESERSGTHLPIVAITANAMKGDREKCLNAGMDDYISKPVTVASVKAVLEKYLPIQTSSVNTPAPINDTQNTETQVIDRNRLALISGNDPSLAAEFADLFVADVTQRVAQMSAAIDAGDAEAVRAHAHTIKGASGNLGAEKLQEAAQRLEKSGREGDIVRCREQFRDLEEEFARVREALGRAAGEVSA